MPTNPSPFLKFAPIATARAAVHEFLQRAEAADRTPRLWRDRRLGRSLSMVVAIYNVEPYIARFLRSLEEQTTGLHNVQIILVNDGSTDASGEIARRWADRHRDVAIFLDQPNQGVSAARNAGLKLATGDWISFPDPDDYLSRRYLARIDAELSRHPDLMLVAARPVIVDDATGQVVDTHPTRYRFRAHRRTLRRAGQMGNYLQMQVCSAWLRTDLLRKHNLQFDESVRPTFEDGHLIYNLFLREPLGNVLFLSPATYFYRRRVAATSLVQGARTKPDWYTTQMRAGYLSLLEAAKERYGHVPAYLQQAVLYEIVARIRYLDNYPERARFLTAQQRAEFHQLLDEIFAHIDLRTIERFQLGGMTEEQRVPLLWIFKRHLRLARVYFEKYDAAKELIQLSWYSPVAQPFTPRFKLNQVEVQPLFQSQIDSDVLVRPFCRRNYAWIKAKPADVLAVELDSQAAQIRYRGHRPARSTIGDLLDLKRTLEIPAKLSPRATSLRQYATSPRAVVSYGNCWLFMDGPDRADDNAEHLYRYVAATMPDRRCFYVLDPSSPDWKRLEAEGFNLIALNSREHIAAWLNAEVLALSNLEHFQLWPLPKDEVADMLRAKLVFLQHGVILHDLSRWTNTKPVDLFVTSTAQEYRSISSQESNYRFSGKEVRLTGLPRHDALHRSAAADRDIILLAPTWRRHLTDETTRVGMVRGKVPGFETSDFARNWGALLRSERLRELAEAHGSRLVFCPHPHFAIYSEDLDIPAWVEVINTAKGAAYQPLLSRTRLMVTDYSSVAFDAAFVDSRLVYFQFDRHEMLGSAANGWKAGYFDYTRDGFGPVADTPAEALAAVEAMLSGNGDDIYRQRREATFAFRDGRNCERVAAAIVAMLEPDDLGRAPASASQPHEESQGQPHLLGIDRPAPVPAR